MLLKEIIKNPLSTRYYIERHVNDGSPSGFSTIHTTSPETSQFGLTPWFHPYICIAPNEYFKNYGEIPSEYGQPYSKENNWLLVHPDMKSNKFFDNKKLKIMRADTLEVIPTASGRTVQIVNKSSQDYVKLHFDGILGRVRRELPYIKAISGPEISRILIKSKNKNELFEKLSFFPETGARVLRTKTKNKYSEWGMVWRINKPYGLEKDSFKYLIPAFSLFSFDRLAIHHPPLLKQIIDHTQINSEKYLYDVLISPLIKCYFNLILTLGLQPEWNSQNLLIGFNEDFSSAVFIMRDLESVDKDLTMMDSLGIKHNFDSQPFKCIEKSQYNYQIKHSFMYDFKLGESIFDPFLKLLNKFYKIDMSKSRETIKDISSEFINKLPVDFYPKDKWYMFDRVLVDQSKKERPYLEIENPKFRH